MILRCDQYRALSHLACTEEWIAILSLIWARQWKSSIFYASFYVFLWKIVPIVGCLNFLRAFNSHCKSTVNCLRDLQNQSTDCKLHWAILYLCINYVWTVQLQKKKKASSPAAETEKEKWAASRFGNEPLALLTARCLAWHFPITLQEPNALEGCRTIVP